MKIEGDSSGYEIFKNCISSLKNPIGVSLEIGIRRGLGSATIIDAYRDIHPDVDLIHIGIDPYGSLPYSLTEKNKEVLDYNTQMKRETLVALTTKYEEYNFVPMTDTFYFKAFKNGYPIYEDKEKLINQYELVHFDGQHDLKSVMKAVEFFTKRVADQTYFIFDDIDVYDHSQVVSYVKNRGFTDFITTSGRFDRHYNTTFEKKHAMVYNK